ncbi:MAG TPA: polysaccharide export protein [Thermodesulfobacteriaceae bacterium]|nr:polysaccharide export protein [Thermodesulfobacteriaceae bacterium]
MNRLYSKIFSVSFILFILALPAIADQTPSFRLGPGDVLEISVWKDPDLTRQVIVQPDGYISFPLVGQIKAGGRTILEVHSDIVNGLKEYIPSPTVSVLPVKIESYKIYVVGKVNKPGIFVLPNPVSVVQAISLAGGTNPFASEGNILILRQGPDGSSTAIEFDYDDVAEGKHMEQNIILKSGDVVIIP